MDANLFLGIILGGLGSIIFFGGIAGLFFFIIFMINKDLKYFIPIINYTGGQPTVEFHKAKRLNHKTLGEVYFIPALRKQKRQYLAFLGTKYEYPTKKGKYFVFFVDRDGDKIPMEFVPTVEEVKEMIVNYRFLKPEELENLSQEEKIYLEKAKDKTKTFFKVSRKIITEVLRPVPKNIRKFVLDNDREIEKENPSDLTWWDKNKQEVVILGIAFIVGLILIMTLILTYQHADKVVASAQAVPPWVQSFINASQSNVAVPKIG